MARAPDDDQDSHFIDEADKGVPPRFHEWPPEAQWDYFVLTRSREELFWELLELCDAAHVVDREIDASNAHFRKQELGVIAATLYGSLDNP